MSAALAIVANPFKPAPYGEALTPNVANDTLKRVAGQAELYYYPARYYDPKQGRPLPWPFPSQIVSQERFVGSAHRLQSLQTDPIGTEDQMNLYNYVHNDPINNFDPYGRSAWTKLGKFILKGGDLGATFAGSIADYKTLTGKGVSGWARAGAAVNLISELAPVSTRDVGEASSFAGGAYKKLTGKSTPNKPLECHHCPADSVSPLSKGNGPAIQMDKADHKQTLSNGNSREAQAYRQQQKELIDQGDFQGAQQMDIDDVQNQFGDKCDEAIKQMQDYTKEVDPN